VDTSDTLQKIKENNETISDLENSLKKFETDNDMMQQVKNEVIQELTRDVERLESEKAVLKSRVEQEPSSVRKHLINANYNSKYEYI